MRNSEIWKPTQYIIRKGRLYASNDPKNVGIGSRLIALLVASAYESYIPQYAKGNLADIGCGFVPLYEYYRSYVDNATTIDWGNSYHKNQFLDIETDLNLAPIIGIENDSFNTIICSDVLEHIYKPNSLLNEFNRIMKTGGYLILNVPFYYWVHEAPHDYHRYTEYALKRYLIDSGFEIIEFKPLGGALATWIDLSSKCLCGVGCIGKILAALLQRITLTVNEIKFGKRLLYYKNQTLPLGYFLVARKITAVKIGGGGV
jgi:SAM-dependent methyltransferase